MFGMTTAALMWSMVFGSIGTGYFIYGKRQGEALWLIAGLLLGGVMFFVYSSGWIIVIGLLLTLLPWIWRRFV